MPALRIFGQSEDIAQALDQLSSVQELNERYKAAIELPSLRTPSQIRNSMSLSWNKKAWKSWKNTSQNGPSTLPDFSKKPKITGAQVGSAVHELMQRLDLSWLVTEDTVREALETVHAEQAIKDKINLQMILDFFDTDLGREILANTTTSARSSICKFADRFFVTGTICTFVGLSMATCYMMIILYSLITRQTNMTNQANSANVTKLKCNSMPRH